MLNFYNFLPITVRSPILIKLYNVADFARMSAVHLKSVAGFREVQAIVRPATTPSFLQMLGIMVADPFYAVIGKKNLL